MSNDASLMQAALQARERAYAPYSGFWVGAAVEDEYGMIHTGCNVENAAYPQGACAEANAIGAMVAGGGRRIAAIAIAGGKAGALEFCTPCGGCRQRILEFADAHIRILLRHSNGRIKAFTIADLLPYAFSKEGLG